MKTNRKKSVFHLYIGIVLVALCGTVFSFSSCEDEWGKGRPGTVPTKVREVTVSLSMSGYDSAGSVAGGGTRSAEAEAEAEDAILESALVHLGDGLFLQATLTPAAETPDSLQSSLRADQIPFPLNTEVGVMAFPRGWGDEQIPEGYFFVNAITEPLRGKMTLPAPAEYRFAAYALGGSNSAPWKNAVTAGSDHLIVGPISPSGSDKLDLLYGAIVQSIADNNSNFVSIPVKHLFARIDSINANTSRMSGIHRIDSIWDVSIDNYAAWLYMGLDSVSRAGNVMTDYIPNHPSNWGGNMAYMSINDNDTSRTAKLNDFLIFPGSDTKVNIGKVRIDGRTYPPVSTVFNSKLEGGKYYTLRLNFITETAPITDDPISDGTYVGAFWRALQRGERLIRIPVPAGPNRAPWTATVARYDDRWTPGTDGVLLSTAKSLDPQVYQTTPGNAESYQVNSGTSSVSGDASNGFIEFRIGLQRPWTATSNSNYNNAYPVRFALVTIHYGPNKGKVQRIFLRQGEDPVNISTTNPYDLVPWSPYNVGDYTNPNAYPSSMIAGFVDFPTKNGYLYQWSNTPAPVPYNPYEAAAPSTWGGPLGTATTLDQVCPAGYRVPTGEAVASDLASLVPASSPGSFNTSIGSVHGYYADGWFDRREITIGNGVSPGTVAAVVSKSNDQIASRGRLIFNGSTDASLFLPAAGMRSSSYSGPLYYSGFEGFYWSSENRIDNIYNAYYLHLTSPVDPTIGNLVRTNGFSVRCVYELCEPLNSISIAGGGSVTTGSTLTLTATAYPTSAKNLTYKWERSFDGIHWFTVIGETASTLEAKAVWPGITQYRVSASNDCSSETTSTTTAKVTGTGDEPPYPPATMYVGAYWRDVQRGERLIRFDRNAPANTPIYGGWAAIVVDDPNNIIRLDTNNSPDAGVWTAPTQHGVTLESLGSGYQVTGATPPYVSGTMSASADLYFRIGLTSTNTAGAVPRYGVVLLTYGNHEYGQRIFIRQGQTPDYISTDSPHNQVLWSPYNLGVYDDPNQYPHFGGDGNGISRMVNYPSQDGYLYRWCASPVVYYNPYEAGAPSNWSPTNSPDFMLSNVCPSGYRLPTGPVTTNEISSLVPDYSTNSSISKLRGYYADGWFDRYPIEDADGSNAASRSVVYKTDHRIASQGMLIFNTGNKASLFLPAAGQRAISNTPPGSLSASGNYGYYWSSEAVSYNAYSVYYYSNTIAITNSSNNAGFSVRCVYDGCESLTAITITGGGVTIPTGTTTPLTANVIPPTATGVSYQWQRNVNGSGWIDVPGATTATLNAKAVIEGVTQYQVIVASKCTPLQTSNPVNVTGIGKEPVGPVTMYVGAYWKNNQHGERLIRIDRNAVGDVIDGEWRATVIEGTAFIRLDTQDAKTHDSGLWTSGGPNISGCDAGFEGPTNTYQVANGATLLTPVSGIMDATTNQLYFRIGLTATQNAGSAPRYGVVLLTYKNHEYAQRIYIRQGEEPVAISSTPPYNTVRWSPYNLGDYTDEMGMSYQGSDILGLVDYPSKAGYCYVWHENNYQHWNLWEPVSIPNWLTWPSYVPLNFGLVEVCPSNYRLPTTHFHHVPGEMNSLIPDVANSSLGTAWGYYADGWFDRRKIETANGGSPGNALTAVSKDGIDVAYWGVLFYNNTTGTNTNASLFLPAAGERNANSQLEHCGAHADYWSNQKTSFLTDPLHLDFWNTGTFYLMGTQGGRQGLPVRCVYDDQCKQLSSVSISSVPETGSELPPGQTVVLTANIVPSSGGASAPITYEWYRAYSASNPSPYYELLATTSTPTYTVTIPNDAVLIYYAVAAHNNCSYVTQNRYADITIVPLSGGSASRITWDAANQQYALTTDPRDAGLYFKWGSVVGIFSGSGSATQNLQAGTNTSNFSAATHIPINFTSLTITDTWSTIPSSNATTINAAYQTSVNVKAGLGDPCRLVGLDLNNIKNKSEGAITLAERDNGKWRMPTQTENQQFTGYPASVSGPGTGDWWWGLNQNPGPLYFDIYGVPCAQFPYRNAIPVYGKFFPAAGYRAEGGQASDQRTSAVFPSSSRNTSFPGTFESVIFTDAYVMFFDITTAGAYPVRCVPQ